MNSIDYNVFNLSLENGLNNHAISSGKDYIILLKSPVGANVQVRLNSNQGDLIPLKENYAIKAKDIKEIFISADIVPAGTITIGQSNSVEGFEIITAPTVNEIEEIGKINSFGNALLSQLDKIINPFELISQDILFNESFTSTQVINTTISHDKIIITPSVRYVGSPTSSLLYIFIDNIKVSHNSSYYAGGGNGWFFNNNGDFVIENKKGSNLIITSAYSTVTIKNYNKKV